ncbi:GntR family transcriptional repressor for pyruvate dehydrogenase complex [Mycetocola sp. BIGb0189]|uniref:FadR/GntR family transcriptional regulator n=1 Tax=Mycetocola sp. BIGb0189 TaxID=2940604 RepID=UPI0021670418|nr:FadR/GntR family transcriptional regulator [Mycetocola sp. BIGb0189]MCS4277112.1 GntR family transcriptional repressor for pyruvate dehydrogenase complex [Mycetocola sp. BIGb0189]
MPVTDDAMTRIRDMIVSGQLGPGERLPPEQELSDMLGISRSSLREAVKALDVIGVLRVRRGDGTYVTDLEPENLMEALAFVVEMHHDDSVLELFEVRRILEPAASAMATGRITPEELATLREEAARAHEGMSVEELVAHDVEFHRHLIDSSGNSYLSSLLQALSSATVRARIWRGLTQESAVERTLAEHAAIVDALESRDPELVKARVTAHVLGVEEWLRSSING